MKLMKSMVLFNALTLSMIGFAQGSGSGNSGSGNSGGSDGNGNASGNGSGNTVTVNVTIGCIFCLGGAGKVEPGWHPPMKLPDTTK